MTLLRRMLVVLACAMSVSSASAEVNRGDGSQTGDGSTPFTGLAQAPEANLFVGASTTSIPIEVSPGRKSLTPELALAYNSNGGPSPYGYGWDLPLGKIQRSTKHGVLSCTDDTYRNDFVLVLPGANVECTLGLDGNDVNRCVPKIEESFVRIKYLPSTNEFEAWDKSGLYYYFGDDRVTSRTATPGNDGWSLFQPGQPCGYTFSWALSRIVDPNGNSLDITYIKEENVLYPDNIRYGANSSGLPHQFEVNFVWSNEDAFSRPAGDEIVNSMGGFKAQLKRLLSRIEVRYPVAGPRVRWYSFQYEFQTDAPERLGRQSFLSAVTVYDDDDLALPRADGGSTATTFSYHQDLGAFGFSCSAQTAPWPQNRYGLLQGPTYKSGRYTQNGSTTTRDIFDINGDGFVDMVDYTPPDITCFYCWSVYLGSPQGFSTTPTPWNHPIIPNYPIRDVTINGSESRTTQDTFDIDGDGIPDSVKISGAAGQPWVVYKGYVTTDGMGFESQATSWPAPDTGLANAIRYSGAWHFLGWDGSSEQQGVVDLNGDGLPDLVRAYNVEGETNWRVWFNTGSGFETSWTSFPVAHGPMSFTNDTGAQILGLVDMNGDGLPEQVFSFDGSPNYSGAWEVALNTGHGTTETKPWTLPESPCDHWTGYHWNGLRQALYQPGSDVVRDLIDINGDGLPDVVDACSFSPSPWSSGNNPFWTVYLNRGDGFSAAQTWASPTYLIRDLDDHGQGNNGETWEDTFDIDGDGLVDYVDFRFDPIKIYRSADGAWCAAASQNATDCLTGSSSGDYVIPNPDGTRPDLLEQMENGLGGSTMLEYRPSTEWDNTGGDGVPDLPFNTWTVTRIERDDGMCDGNGANCTGVTGSSHSLVTRITYEDGRFDPIAREFRGFFRVWSENDDPVAPNHLGRATWFHQTAALSGRVIQTGQYAVDGGDPMSKPLTSSVNIWECADPTSGAVLGSCPEQPEGDVWVRLRTTYSYTYSNYSGSSYRLSLTANVSWQQCNSKYYGNVAHSYTGDAFNSSTWVHTHTDYACLDNTSSYIVDKPTHVWVKDTNDSHALEEKWFEYDGGTLSKGNVTKVYSWLDRVIGANLPEGDTCPSPPAGGMGACVSTTMVYDGFYGNLTVVTDANGHPTTTSYDQATNIYPDTVTNALGHKVTTEYDPGCGKPLSQTITYTGGTPPRSRREYDTFCRLVKTAMPDEDIATAPHQQVFYYLGYPQRPTAVVTSSREPNSPFGGYLLASTFSDALGRMIEEKHQAVVEGSYAVVAGATRAFDAHGDVTAQYAPFSGAGLLDIYMSPPAGTGVTTSEYDALGRVTKVTNPDNKFRTAEHNIAWQTTTKDECYNDAGCTGGKVIEKRDVFGNTIEKQSYEQDTLKAKTQYTYDGAGRLLTTEQWDGAGWNANTMIVVQYDSLGRKVQLDDPDSGGSWRYGYDKVGNLIYQDDPTSSASTPSRPQSTQFAYDAINRATTKYYMSVDEYCPVNVQCTATAQIEYHYDEAPVPYALGHLTSVDDLSGTTFFEQYDVRGRLLQQNKQIDAAGRLTGATTRYQYDVADHLTQITYPDGEVVLHGYNLAGQIVSLRNTYATPTWYLNNLTYDLFGRQRVITHGNGTTDTRTYGTTPSTNYRLNTIATKKGTSTLLDYRYSSYSANGQIKAIDDYRTRSRCTSGVLCGTMTLTYDGLGRLAQASGPNLPTQNTYQYDHLGNMILKEGNTLTYAVKPHTLSAINGSPVTHDDNGNRTGKPQQTYDYTTDDRVETIAVTNQPTVSMVYDYTGQKVAQVKGTSVTRYYNSLLEVEPDGKLVKHYFAGGMRIASARVTPPPGVASLEHPAMMFAQVPAGNRALIVLVRDDLTRGCLLAIGIIGLGLLVAPWRRKPIVGIAVRHGHIIAVIIVFSLSTFPLPILVEPASAQTTPAATLYHYHLDHLGSTQAVTSSSGGVLEYIRYKAYGEIRGRYTSGGGSTSTFYRHEFTTYETEWTSNLEYAGSRWYDPALGMFLTHDPARQFASPYAYGPWDPVNGTDPNGAIFGIDDAIAAIIIAAVAGAAASGIQAAVNGASPLDALKAAAIGAAIGGASGAVGFALQPFLTATITTPLINAGMGPATAQAVADGVLLSGGLAQAGYGASRGDYTGVIGLGVSVGLASAIGAQPAQGGSKGGSAGLGQAKDNALADLGAATKAGYSPETNDMKILHAANTFRHTEALATWLTGASSGPLHYLGRILVTPFVTLGGIGYEFKTMIGYHGQAFDGQPFLDWLWDTPGDLIANTYGQVVSLIVPNNDWASLAIRGAQVIPGPDHSWLLRAVAAGRGWEDVATGSYRFKVSSPGGINGLP